MNFRNRQGLMLKWKWVSTLPQGNKTRREIVNKRLQKKTCECDLLNNSTNVRQWVGNDGSKYPMMCVYKRAGWLYFKWQLFVLIHYPFELPVCIRVLGTALFSHEPFAGSGWEVMRRSEAWDNWVSWRESCSAWWHVLWGWFVSPKKLCWSFSPPHLRMWPYLK